MHFLSHAYFGQCTTVAGVIALWLLLAGEIAPMTVAEGLAVALAATFWVRLIDG
jgi:hypothetical protein